MKRPRGRPAIALALLGFLLVTTGVIWRRSYGISQSRTLRDLERNRVELEAQNARLESEVREAASRARLAPIAEQRLRLHVPNDSQVVILQSPPRRTHGTP
jgi:cell division protein FtsL